MGIAYTWLRVPGGQEGQRQGTGMWWSLHQTSPGLSEEQGLLTLVVSAFLHTSWDLYLRASGGCFVQWLRAAQRVELSTRECRVVVKDPEAPLAFSEAIPCIGRARLSILNIGSVIHGTHLNLSTFSLFFSPSNSISFQ